MTSLSQRITVLENSVVLQGETGATGPAGPAGADGGSITQAELDTKQNSINDLVTDGFLTAGDNITFSTVGNNTTISSTGGGSSSFVGFRAVGSGGSSFNFTGRISQLLDNTNTPPYSYDTHNLFNTTTGTFFPDRNGYWQMGFKFYNQAGAATTTQTNQLKLKRGGVELGPIIFAGNNAGQSEDVTTTAYLVVGDEIYLTHEGTAVTVVKGVANNFFEARYVGS